jgi:hypothetical protein
MTAMAGTGASCGMRWSGTTSVSIPIASARRAVSASSPALAMPRTSARKRNGLTS